MCGFGLAAFILFLFVVREDQVIHSDLIRGVDFAHL